MDFEQAKKVLQLTDARIRKFGSVDASTIGANLESRLARELALDSGTLAAPVEQRDPVSSLFHGLSHPKISE